MTDEEAAAAVAAVFDQQGFEPEVSDGDIRMHRCPFQDLAEAHPGVVCGVHRGLISGALAALGSELEVASTSSRRPASPSLALACRYIRALLLAVVFADPQPRRRAG